MSMSVAAAKRFIAETRALLSDEDQLHDMTTTEWATLAAKLCDELAEFVWLREEAES